MLDSKNRIAYEGWLSNILDNAERIRISQDLESARSSDVHGAFFELYQHEWLLRKGFEVTFVGSPDFLVSKDGERLFYIEATHCLPSTTTYDFFPEELGIPDSNYAVPIRDRNVLPAKIEEKGGKYTHLDLPLVLSVNVLLITYRYDDAHDELRFHVDWNHYPEFSAVLVSLLVSPSMKDTIAPFLYRPLNPKYVISDILEYAAEGFRQPAEDFRS